MFRILFGRIQPLFGTMVLACVFCVRTFSQPGNDSVEEHFRAAQKAQQQGHLDAAVEEYQTVLRLQPNVPEVYANLGLVYYAQAKFADSAKALTTAEKLKPGMRGVDLWLGIDEVKLDRPAEGTSHLEQAVHQDPNDKVAQSWLGTALWNSGKMEAALLELRTASTRFPDDPDLLFAAAEAYGKAVHQGTESLLENSAGSALSDRIYAGVYAEEHDWTKAEGHLRRAIERDPRSVDARLELSHVFFAQDKLADALGTLDNGLAISPISAVLLARSGEILLLMQKPGEGLARIRHALDIDRSAALDALGLPVENRIGEEDAANANPQLVSQCREAAASVEASASATPARAAALAALHAQAGDTGAAMRDDQAIGAAEESTHPETTLLDQAITAMHQHRYDDAEGLFVRWLAVHPADRPARYNLILVRRHLSMEEITHLIAVAPDSYHVHQLLGQLYVNNEEDDKALKEYLAVAAARPDLPGVHFWLGHLYWKHGDADHALAELTHELQIDPGNAEANGELGAVLVAQDRAKEAIPRLESAIKSKPDLWPAYAQLGRAYASEKNYPRAEQLLRQALAHDPDATAHYRLALVLHAEGKNAQAAQAFAQVRAIKNENMTATSADQGAAP